MFISFGKAVSSREEYVSTFSRSNFLFDGTEELRAKWARGLPGQLPFNAHSGRAEELH